MGDFIDFIHGKFPYIRYDYFLDSFVYYPERAVSKAYYAQQHQTYQEAAKTALGLKNLIGQWFPGVPCSVDVTLAEDVQRQVDEYLTQNNWLNGQREIRQNERREILAQLNRITGENSRQLASILGHYGYSLRASSHRTNALHTITRSI